MLTEVLLQLLEIETIGLIATMLLSTFPFSEATRTKSLLWRRIRKKRNHAENRSKCPRIPPITDANL